MVRRQIERRGVSDPRVLDAMIVTPREAFVPEAIRFRAFEDGALPLPCGQTISQPFVVASMCQALALPPEARVLEIGTGSGYAAAVLAHLADRVFTIERHEELATAARERLARLGYATVTVRCGDGTRGWVEHAPYHGILVSAGAPEVPTSLKAQLTIGGRLVLPVGRSPLSQVLVRVTRKTTTKFAESTFGRVRFVPLVGDEGWENEEGEPRRGWW